MRRNHAGNLSRFIRYFLAVLAVTLTAASVASAESFTGEGKVHDSYVTGMLSAGKHQDVIVIFDDSEASAKALEMRHRARALFDTPDIVAARAEFHRAKKADVRRIFAGDELETLKDYDKLPAAFLRIKSFKALKKLAGHSGVAGVYMNRRYSHFLAESLPLIGQPAAYDNGFSGAGTAVVVLDTGIDYNDPAFGSCADSPPQDCLSLPAVPNNCSVACVHDFAANDNALDDDGHGTNVSGIVVGVAPDAKIVNLDIFEKDGYAYTDKIISAINWAIAHRSLYNIVSMNMSFGGSASTSQCSRDVFASPIAAARNAGILSAIASGNGGKKNAISSPACVPAAVSVGAVYDDYPGYINWGVCRDYSTAPDRVTCFSNSAGFLTLLAPGSEISSAGWTMSGTSQATPHVAGAIAVLRASNAFASDTVDETVNRLISTGVAVTDASNGIKKPRINLAAALGSTPVQSYSLSGTIRTSGQSPVGGVAVAMSGAATGQAVTDSSGRYVFDGLGSGSYTVRPSKYSFTFSPASSNITLGSNSVTADFTVKTYSISGTVKTAYGTSLRNVTVRVTGCDITKSAVTNSKGSYKVSDLPNCSYNVVPSRSGYSFTPIGRTVSVSNANVSRVDFRSQ